MYKEYNVAPDLTLTFQSLKYEGLFKYSHKVSILKQHPTVLFAKRVLRTQEYLIGDIESLVICTGEIVTTQHRVLFISK